ncbi:hypothetical protein [Actinoplanes aureus]|uniref:Uncharacterized protein n=1 Tax=Actinoplanes aureus TaxID=2792083 RepID=A0A931CDG7_9ACTN|nr:hypothetical protein [Actinoplanes aureus]MBG0566614.1 hypothetical protein [Actinoplanes aureus]
MSRATADQKPASRVLQRRSNRVVPQIVDDVEPGTVDDMRQLMRAAFYGAGAGPVHPVFALTPVE